MQTTLLGLAIAFILALLAALIGPYFIDWNQFRPQFETEATQVIGAPVRVMGKLDARLLPTPSLQLRSVVVGGVNDLGKVRAEKLDVEFSLGSLMRGEWRATELTVNEMALDLGLDPQGRIDWPVSTGKFNLGSLAIDRLNLTGRIALHDAASRGALELNDIAFSGDVRSLAGSVRGDGNFMVSGTRYPFRVSSGQAADGGGTRIHFNIDPGARMWSADLDGVLSFEARAPRFEGALTLVGAPRSKADDSSDALPVIPWRIAAKVKADHSAARLEQLETSYGAEDRAIKFGGAADIRFGASPLLHAVLSARQLDADRFIANDDYKNASGNGGKKTDKAKSNTRNNSKNETKSDTKNDTTNNASEPKLVWPRLRALMAVMPQAPLATQIEFGAEQIMLGGRPLQNLSADLRADNGSWKINRLDFRAPGATHVVVSGAAAPSGSPDSFKAALTIDSSDPDTLQAWLQGRSDMSYRSQKPLRLRGDVSVTADRFAIDAMQAEIGGDAVQGRIAVAHQTGAGSRVEAELKAAQLDLDAAVAFMRSLAGPSADWPDQAQLSLDIGRAISAGREWRPFVARLGYGPNTISLDQLKIGDANSVTMEGTGHFDRVNATGTLALDASAASLGQITGLVAPFAPGLSSRLDAMGKTAGPAHLKLALDLDKDSTRSNRAQARAVLGLDAPQLKGVTTITAKPDIAALHGFDIAALRRSEVEVQSSLSSEQSASLLALLGIDRVVTAGEGPVQVQASVAGAWPAPWRINVRTSGAQLDAEAQGTAEPWAAEPKASVNLKIRRANLAPLLDLKPSDALAQNISLTSRVSVVGSKIALDDLDGAIGGSRLRGHMTINGGDERNVEGEIGLDTLDIAPAFALALGAAGRDATEPLGSGLRRGWRGHVAFQALRGSLPGGGELRPFSGVLKSDGQSLTLDAIKGTIGGGDAAATIDARQTSGGLAINARVQFTGVDGSALRYRGLAMPAGKISLQMTLASQGRSASALTGALSGNGTVMLDSAEIAGLNPRAIDAGIRASDEGQAIDDAHLRQIVEPVLSTAPLSVARAQIPFAIKDGRLRVGATTLEAQGARAVISGGYDIPADQADIRASVASNALVSTVSPPEIQLFAAGSPDKLNRTVDVAALSSWLAVRAIDRETRRLDSIERGEQPPALPASVPPATATLPAAGLTGAMAPTPSLPSPSPSIPSPSSQSLSSPSLSGLPPVETPMPARDPRRLAPKARLVDPRSVAPKLVEPRPVEARPVEARSVEPRFVAPRPAPPVSNAPVVSQQLAPLPPPIEVRPAPGVVRQPKPRPPLSLHPQVESPTQ